MTLTMAWIRNVGSREELVFASDSRLSGGSDWDCCSKLMPLPRKDCLIAFAGDTRDAFPLMLQLRNWIELDPNVSDTSYDINDLKKRIRDKFNDMRVFITDLPHGRERPDPPDCELLFGGWSWKADSFKIWRFHYVKQRDKFDFEPGGNSIKVGRQHPIAFAGTREAVELARDNIIRLLKSRNRFHTPYFDMEPFEILRDIIRDRKFRDIGGPPQLAKIYKNGQTQVFAVRWDLPDSRELAILGRPLLNNERVRLRIIDPDKINFLPEKTIQKKLLVSQKKNAGTIASNPVGEG